MTSTVEIARRAAAERAASFVEDGMTLGLGTGSTASLLVEALGRRIRDEGLRLRAVPTSRRTAELARRAGIALVALEEVRWLDLVLDGADEVDPDLGLVKGGGGALLHEKIVATAADRVVILVDAAKRVDRLGAFPLPVEVVPFGWRTTQALVEEALIGLDVRQRKAVLRLVDGRPFVTEEGNHVLDLHLGAIGRARQLGLVLNQVPGVVENGLFLNICDVLVTGYGDGRSSVHDHAAGPLVEDRADGAEGDNIFVEIAV